MGASVTRYSRTARSGSVAEHSSFLQTTMDTDTHKVISNLPPRHRQALQWFADRAGSEQPWPEDIPGPDGLTHLASRAKGIYKPAWSKYALLTSA